MIRPALPDDVPRMLEMGRAFVDEAGYAESVGFDPPSFARTLYILGLANLLFVAEKDGAVVGMAAADVAPSICNQAVRVGQECFFYVEPAHRKGVGKQLINALECAAKNQGATFFDVVAEEGKRAEALARIYRAGRFSPATRTFRKRLS